MFVVINNDSWKCSNQNLSEKIDIRDKYNYCLDHITIIEPNTVLGSIISILKKYENITNTVFKDSLLWNSISDIPEPLIKTELKKEYENAYIEINSEINISTSICRVLEMCLVINSERYAIHKEDVQDLWNVPIKKVGQARVYYNEKYSVVEEDLTLYEILSVIILNCITEAPDLTDLE